MNNRFQRITSISLLLVGVLLVFSCAGPPEVGISEDTLYDDTRVYYEREYQLGSNDTLEIVYHYSPKPTSKVYYLAVGDVIRVEFAYHPEINRDLNVLPDGNVSIPRKGDLQVLGLTVTQVKEKLEDLFALDFKDPVITITMIKYNTAIEHLKRAITTAPRGQSKLTTIRPDGWVSFPVIQDIKAAGKTIPQLREEVQREYSKLIDHLTITLILKVMQANVVYIAGEVEKPAQYLMEGPMTVMQLVARAGGFKDTAERESVLIISRDDERKPLARLLNMEEMIGEGNISKDIVLQQFDVVFVPKTAIARRNLFVDQYINGLIPSAFSAGYNLGGVMIQHEPLIR